jgi:plastocyanin
MHYWRAIGVLGVSALATAAAGVAGAGAAKAPVKTTLHLRADPGGDLRFTRTKLSAKHGSITIVMKNPAGSAAPHGVAVANPGKDKKGKVVDPGGTSRVTVKLRKGAYTFYCPYDGHRAIGMTGKLVVR